jgi:hypothetical protein
MNVVMECVVPSCRHSCCPPPVPHARRCQVHGARRPVPRHRWANQQVRALPQRAGLPPAAMQPLHLSPPPLPTPPPLGIPLPVPSVRGAGLHALHGHHPQVHRCLPCPACRAPSHGLLKGPQAPEHFCDQQSLLQGFCLDDDSPPPPPPPPTPPSLARDGAALCLCLCLCLLQLQVGDFGIAAAYHTDRCTARPPPPPPPRTLPLPPPPCSAHDLASIGSIPCR